MGSIGLGMEINDSDKATSYTPYVIYNKIEKDGSLTLTSLNLIPEAGDYIEIEGHRISHKTPVAGGNTSLLKVGFDNFGHITASAAPTVEEIRQVAHIRYGDLDPSDTNNNIVGEEGDIYLWIQSK